MNFLKRDHETGTCPMNGKRFYTPDSDDWLCWRYLSCSECGEKIGHRSCELRKYLKGGGIDHVKGICPITRKAFTLPISPVSTYICDECGNEIMTTIQR